AYWNGDNPNIKLYSLEEALRKEIIELFDTDETLDELLIQVLEEESIENLERSEHINPRDYQIEAVKNWMENMRGIFKMATGTGKTKTAIYLMEKIETQIDKNFFVIVVPD